MHLHPTRISPHILFVPLNYWPAMTDLYSSPDTQWLSLGSLGFFPSLLPILLSPPFTHLFQFSPLCPQPIRPPGIPGVLSPTVVFDGPVCCRHGWCGSGAQPCVRSKRSNGAGQWPCNCQLEGFARTRPCVMTAWCGYRSSEMISLEVFYFEKWNEILKTIKESQTRILNKNTTL